MSITASIERAVQAAASVPTPGRQLRYGTAGFRDKADVLQATMLRVGFVSALRSTHIGKTTGVMITASHNPVEDNGVKLVDCDGGMLAQEWERYATDVANAEGADMARVLGAIVDAERIQDDGPRPRVVVGRDTRPSSDELHKLVLRGLAAFDAEVVDLGVVTTPIPHFVVRATDRGQHDVASEDGYWRTMCHAFLELMEGTPAAAERGTLVVDCADGVGGFKFERLRGEVAQHLQLDGRNVAGEGDLNHQCGAEFVQKQLQLPRGLDLEEETERRMCSVDGDADRLVYFTDRRGELVLLDGDKIAALAGAFLREQIDAVGLSPAPSLGVVQTAYANGASTAYLHDVADVPVAVAKTGVKHVHHAAEAYDVGIYFEANGHGTVLFKDAFLDRVRAAKAQEGATPEQRLAAERILLSSTLINQAVGDAFADMLFVEAALAIKGWTLQDWEGMYSDLPSRQLKVRVADRTKIATSEDETKVLEPASLQAALDTLMGEVVHGRAFVRPSGTEDVVRIYAEAETRGAADALAAKAARAAYDHAGGVGPAPEV